ncbi:hypothetical protein VULLAG_LOCUS14590 [Vulpes lagopus]
MEVSPLMQQCYTGTMGEAPDSVSVLAPFCWFSSDGTSVALRFGHWGMGEAPDESVVSLELHTGATFDSEVPRRRGNKYQYKKSSSCVKTFLPTFHRSSISLHLLWAPLLLRHGFRISLYTRSGTHCSSTHLLCCSTEHLHGKDSVLFYFLSSGPSILSFLFKMIYEHEHPCRIQL